MSFEIRNFFYPKSICVVGASTKEKSIGYELLKTISTFGYREIIYPVNPKAESVLGYKCYKSIEEINAQIDLAIIAVPKQFVGVSIDTLLQKGVKSIVLITAGFKEIGKAGEEIENKILQKIKDAGARMVGPNCMGVINTVADVKLNATFVAEKPEFGNTGFFSQSGALGAAVLNSLRETNIKFAHFISAGNKADINESDLLKYWQTDDNIKTLTYYLESFVNGEKFIIPFLKNEIDKPVIVLKAGKTAGGMKAASSHTGALSSKDKVVDALLNQFGIIRVKDLNEMFNTAKGFENFKSPKGNRVAVITNAGGPAILAVDSLVKENLELAELTEETRNKLREIVHPEGSINNPVDLLPGGNAEAYKKVNEIVIEDDNVDAVISIFVEPVMVKPFDVVEAVYDVKTDKPIIQAVMPLPEFWDIYKRDSKKQLPVFKNPEEPAEVISNMLFYNKSKRKLTENKNQYELILGCKESKEYNFEKGFLTQKNVNEIAFDYGIPVIKNILIKTGSLERLHDEIYPLVIKGIGKDAIHKSELNAVKLDIRNKDELLASAEEIEKSFIKYNFKLDEFLIQPFIKTKHEILLGGFRDPSFGPVIMFGTGGKYVEVVCDTVIKSAYLCGEDIDDMISSTVIGKILKGVRGERPIDIDNVKNIILSSARMLIENKNITEFDLNPLIVADDNSLHAVDIRIKWE
ncbi:MAG: acetate--CoA ligase family protein [Ignavibacteria bacterium]|jgi:acetyltransferase